ncbi:hypothetical protein F373_gp181 [Bacillus phage SP-10]|uniref:hypothetical protein n=1 Tax=Bacillus phage SP10 TaxID=941058 RepID=UPI0002198B89|nr:hypothetical protein F373_gp181 [Bacillus phage SP-10]BAK52993.1 hypothetical protein [Bacillus phage SP-10]
MTVTILSENEFSARVQVSEGSPLELELTYDTGTIVLINGDGEEVPAVELLRAVKRLNKLLNKRQRENSLDEAFLMEDE